MTPSNPTADVPALPRRKLWKWLLILPVVLLGGAWWITEPLSDRATPLPIERRDDTVDVPPVVKALANDPIVWPDGLLEGEVAKKILLASTVRSLDKLEKVAGYTATLRKQERIGGKLGSEQTLAMKVRNQPFAIYLKFLAPKAGKEVLYSEGHHDNKVIAHNGDWTRRLVPRLAVPPDSAVALADTRHPVTEAGLVNLARKLLKFREMDINDEKAVTILDRITEPDGRTFLRSTHTHSVNDGKRPFTRVVIFYDLETQYPVRIWSYDWPAPGHSGELELAESFAYDDIKFNAPLTPADFDLENPEYAFMRF